MKTFLIGLVLIIGFLILAYQQAYPSYSWNQKVTVAVQTPEGIVSASSVGRTVLAEGIDFGISGVGNFKNEFAGEAVVLALPNGQFLFSLIQDATSFNLKAFSDVPGIGRNANGSYVRWDESARQTQDLKGARAFPPEHYPMLVTFDDINDPASVKELDSSNLAATFGEGYSLKSITLKITDEDVTHGEVEKVLGWIPEYQAKQFRLNGRKCVACPISSENLSDLLSGSSFSIGKAK